MNIALVAGDSKKDLMVSFCIAYKSILRKHNIYATGSTAEMIKDEVGIRVLSFSPGTLGGVRQLDSRIVCGEIDLMIYFANTFSGSDAYDKESFLFKHCDLHDVPYATNIATAEVLILGLDRGDLAWRDFIKKT